MKYLSTLLLFFSTYALLGQDLKKVSSDTLLMGSRFSFTAIHSSEQYATQSIMETIEEVVRIERLISSWDINSETHKINTNAGKRSVQVSLELFNLIERSKKVSELTQGCFDISYASIDKVWDFKNEYKTPPDAELIAKSVDKIDYRRIQLNRDNLTVFLLDEGMKIGFGAIGKGYAANKAKELMKSKGIESGVVNAGGDLISWGKKINGQPWSVGIIDPTEKDKIRIWLNISDMAVVTSGDYERFIMIEDMRYGHIINPKTGWPTKGVRSVTVICPDAELADALATSVFVLGWKKGIALIDQLNGIECLVIDDANKIHYSKNLEMNYVLTNEN